MTEEPEALADESRALRFDGDFVRGGIKAAGKRRREARLLSRLISRPGLADLTASALNNGDIEADLTPVPDTGNPFIDKLTWFMENIDEILAFVKKIADALEDIFGGLTE